jgi:transposase
MPWKEMSKMDQKQEFIILYKSRAYTITQLAEMFKISRPTAYKYIKRYEDFGMAGLLEISRKPHNISNKTPSDIEKQILYLRNKHPRWGAAKLLVLLEDRCPNRDLPKVTTVNNVLKRNGMIASRKRRLRIEPSFPIFDPKTPNEIWSADFKGKFRMGNKAYLIRFIQTMGYPLAPLDHWVFFQSFQYGLWN